MKLLKLLFLGIAFAAGNAAAVANAAPHPALYSFVDVVRLTVAGPMAVTPPESATEAPIRVAAPLAPAAEPRFSIAGPRQPDKWLLLVAGLALAGWVAHRRLVHSL